MNNPMNLINLKIATAVASVLTVVASFAPKAAAQAAATAPGLWSADSSAPLAGDVRINFTLNTSDMDSNPDPHIGEYTAAIKNLKVNANGLSESVPSVTLDAFRVDTSQWQPNSNPRPIPTPLTGFNTDLNALINNYSPTCNNNPCVNTQGYNKGVVVYEAAFNGFDNTGKEISNRLALFVPSLGDQSLDYQQLVNSLSGLDGINDLQGVFSSPQAEFYFGFSPSGPQTDETPGLVPNPYLSLTPVEAVPEPADTAGVLAFGAMGAISLLRRNRGIQ